MRSKDDWSCLWLGLRDLGSSQKFSDTSEILTAMIFVTRRLFNRYFDNNIQTGEQSRRGSYRVL